MKILKEPDGRYLVSMKSWSSFADTLGDAVKLIIDNPDEI